MTKDIKLGNAQAIGAREEQQDAFGFSNMDDPEFVQHGGAVAVVADGIGGHAHGGEASQLAIREFLLDYMAKPKQTTIPDALYHALIAANRAVSKFAKLRGQTQNCGTTLVAAALHPESLSLYWISGGDSRLYLLRDKQCVQLTSDCNYAGQLVKKISQGTFDREEVKPEANLGALTCFLGMRSLDEVDRAIRPFKVHAGDWLVLCTDGVYNTLNNSEMLDCLRLEPQQACDRLIQSVLAKNLQNQDNATAAIIALELKDAYKAETADMGRPNQEIPAMDKRNARLDEPPTPKPSPIHSQKRNLGIWAILLVAAAISLGAILVKYELL